MTDMPGSLEISAGVKNSHVLVFTFALTLNQYTDNMHLQKVCTCHPESCVCVCVSVAAEVLDSCKKVENQLVSFAAVGVVMDEEAVQEATSTCQAADKLIQVSHGVATSPHTWTHPQPAHGYLGLSACLHLLQCVEIADNVAFTPPCSCDKLFMSSVPGLIPCHIIT